jgi:hypothetical protein
LHRWTGCRSEPDWRKIDFEQRQLDGFVSAAERRQCEQFVERWNEMVRVRRSPDPAPSIGIALMAGYPWLHVYCPGCRSIGEIDLRQVDRHVGALLASLIPSLSCSRCRGQGPLPKLKGLARESFNPEWVRVLTRR